MKKLQFYIFFGTLTLIFPVNAATGWFQDYVLLNVNNVGSNYYWIGSDPSFGTQLNNTNWGQVGSLVLTGADMKYWADGGDNRTGSAFYYMVKSADGTVTYIGPTEVIMDHAWIGGNNYQGTKSGLSVDLLSGLTNGVTYKLHIYAKSWGSIGGDSWLTNSGANYVATFTYNTTPQVTVTGATGIADGTGYTTLSAASTAIGTSQTGKTINVAINASTTEPNAGVSIGAGTWTSLTIYPTADDVTITATSPTANLITFNGADNVKIDGRKNKTGTSRNLTITSPVTANYATIAFINIAQYNTVKYCNIKGSVDGAVGLILFSGTAAATNGNGMNTIDNNLITNAGTRPRLAVYSPGNITNPTVGNKITNNEFKDLINTSIASPAYIFIGGGATATSSDWTITGNSFYETETLNMSYSTGYTTLNFIQLGTTTSSFVGNNNNISDNYFGGTAKQCGGGNYTVVSAAAQGTIHSGIYICAASGGTNSIQNNTFQKISWTNKRRGANWRAIDAYGQGNYNIGTITGNTIGDNITTNSISLETDSLGTPAAGGVVSCSLIGIQINTTGNVAVKNNRIGSLKAYNSNSAYPAPITCIVKNTAAGTVDVTDNFIGSNSISNSIYNNQASGTSSNIVSGIKIYSTVAGNNISNNTIANLTTGGSASMVEGIFIGGTGSSGTASGTTTFTINSNLIHSLFSSTGSVGAQVNGIYINNYVITATCTNNIIYLSSDLDNQVCGFLNQTYAYATKLYHNTVFIGGIGPSGSPRRTAGIWTVANSANSNLDLRNNLFVNNRGGGGTNSALNFNSITTGGAISCNYNNLYTVNNSSVGVYNNGAKTFAQWQATALPINGGTYLPDQNSINLNPNFAISNPLLADAYYPGNGSITTSNVISGLTTDYAGTTRSGSTPTIGALEYGKAIYDGSAWNVGSAPNSSTTDAALTGNYSAEGFICKNLTVNAGKQTTITSGTLAVNGDFTLKSDANFGTATFIDDGGTLTVTGASKVEQYLTAGRNWYVSSPVSGATSNVFAASALKPLYYYVENTPNVWSQITNTTTSLEVMQGYVANPAATGVVTFTGGSLNTGAVTAQSKSGLTRQEVSFKGFNLIGNPYPSYVSWDDATLTNVGTSIWYRSKSTGAYLFQTYNRNGGQGTNGGTKYIPPMQAFWVQVTSGTGTVAFPNTARSHQDQSVFANRLKMPSQNTQKVLRLQISNNINTDETLVYFDAHAANSFDSYDSPKMTNNNAEIPELFTKADDNELVINGMSDFVLNQPLALGFRTGMASVLSIKAGELTNFDADTRLWLVDNLEGMQTDITEGAIYTFNSERVTSDSRFSIIFRSNSGTTGNKELVENNSIVIFKNANNQITVNCKNAIDNTSMVSIYSIMGQKLISKKLVSSTTLIDMPAAAGIYIVSVTNGGKNLTKKISIN